MSLVFCLLDIYKRLTDAGCLSQRMACHLQVYALCKWLGVNFPIEFHETIKGLQWIIPHLDLPWEKPHVHSHLVDSSIPVTTHYSTMHQITGYAPARHKSMISGNCGKHFFSEGRQRRERKLGINASIFGQPLRPMEYKLYFEVNTFYNLLLSLDSAYKILEV